MKILKTLYWAIPFIVGIGLIVIGIIAKAWPTILFGILIPLFAGISYIRHAQKERQRNTPQSH